MVIQRNEDGSYSAYQEFRGRKFVTEGRSRDSARDSMFLIVNRYNRELDDAERFAGVLLDPRSLDESIKMLEVITNGR